MKAYNDSLYHYEL